MIWDKSKTKSLYEYRRKQKFFETIFKQTTYILREKEEENTAFVSVYINGDLRSSRCFKIYSKPPTSSIDNKKAYVTNNDGKLR